MAVSSANVVASSSLKVSVNLLGCTLLFTTIPVAASVGAVTSLVCPVTADVTSTPAEAISFKSVRLAVALTLIPASISPLVI